MKSEVLKMKATCAEVKRITQVPYRRIEDAIRETFIGVRSPVGEISQSIPSIPVYRYSQNLIIRVMNEAVRATKLQ
jgi:hypothetical protein